MSEPPDLTDPDARRAYRRELMAYRRPMRWLGLALLLLGLVCLFWPRLTGEWVMVGPVALQDLGWGAVALGWVVLGFAFVSRTRYHRRRMRGEA